MLTSDAVASISIPLLSVQECKGLRITVETITGQRLTGALKSIDPITGNIAFDGTAHGVISRARNGEVSAAGRTVVRGSAVRLVELPRDMQRAEFLLSFAIQQQQREAASSPNAAARKEGGGGGTRPHTAKKAPAAAPKKMYVKRGSDAAKAQKLVRGLRGKVGAAAASANKA